MDSQQNDDGRFARPFQFPPVEFPTGRCRDFKAQNFIYREGLLLFSPDYTGKQTQTPFWDEGSSINSPCCDTRKADTRSEMKFPAMPLVHGNQILSPDYFSLQSCLESLEKMGFNVCRQANVPEYLRIRGARFGGYIFPFGVQDDGNNNVSTSQIFAQRKPNTGIGALRLHPVVRDISCKLQVSMLTQLTGHTKAVSAITFPMGSNNLYSGSKDESMRVWDCHTGKCAAVIKLEGEVGCMINDGPWIFVGIPNTVKAWNTQTNAVISLGAPVGQVHSLVAGNRMLFAGMQDGNILVWRFNDATNSFEPAASLTGHTLSVVSLVFGANRLYSGSMDKTIRVWDLDTRQCIQTLTEHTSVVTSLLCWKKYLISCSLDQTIKFWDASENGSLKEAYTHQEEHGVLGLCGMVDAQGNPVLLCSCNDNTVRFYDLPSFNERGMIISMEEIRIIHCGPGVLFFTGNGTGELKVWKWSESYIAPNE